MKMRILGALLRKELLLMKRTRFIPALIIMMPVMVMLIIPLVANLDVENVGVTVVDEDHSLLSRRIISDMSASRWLEVVSVRPTHESAMQDIESGRADVLLTIPRELSRRGGSVDISANGVNATKGQAGAAYVAQSVTGTLQRHREEDVPGTSKAEISVLNLYNGTLNFRYFMIPAIMVVLLIVICGFLPALNLVDEKQAGTIEAMNVTPVSRFVFVLSKLIPYWLAGLLIVSIAMAEAWLVYGLVPAGSIWQIYLAVILFTLVMSGLGVTIANRSETMLQSIFVMFAVIMVFQLMGGLFTPIDSMPEWARYITYGVPPRYFNEIMRAVYLKGSSFAELLPQYCALAGFAVALCLLAAVTYSKRTR